jgi:hypothetical protein
LGCNVDASDLDDDPLRGVGDGDIRLAEDGEQVRGARLLQQRVAHGEVGVHANEQDRQAADLPLGGDRGKVVAVRLELADRRSCVGIEAEPAHEKQVEANPSQRFAGRILDPVGVDGAVLRPDTDGDP